MNISILMKTISTLLISVLFATTFSYLSAQENHLTLIQSNLDWVGYGEIGNFSQKGTIQIKKVNIDYENIEEISGSIVIDMRSIAHEDAKLEKHLKAKDFFNVKKYPEAIFKIEKVNSGICTGTLSMNGHESPVSFEISLVESEYELKCSGLVEVDRTLYDIKYNSSSYFQNLGNYAIKNHFDLIFDLTFNKN